MRRYLLPTFLLAALTSAVLFTVAQRDPSKRPSPPGSAEFTLHGKKLAVEYSRPSMRGRKIFGDLLPYGQVWRTGANEATAFTTQATLDLAGATVPAGKYTLYSIPSEGTWKLIISKQTGQWGTDYDAKQDLARVDMQKETLAQPVEQFTISFEPRGNDGGALKLAWEKTAVWVEFREKK